MSEKLLRPKEAAELLGVHPLTLYRWAKSGKIRYIKTPGGRMRYPLSEIQRLLKNKKVGRSNKMLKAVIFVKHHESEKAAKTAEELKRYAESRGFIVQDVIIDTSSGICEYSEAMAKLLSLVKSGKVGRVIIPSRRALSFFCFWVFEELFKAYGVTIDVLHERGEDEYLEILDMLINFVKSKE